jgi:hypothetical protein
MMTKQTHWLSFSTSACHTRVLQSNRSLLHQKTRTTRNRRSKLRPWLTLLLISWSVFVFFVESSSNACAAQESSDLSGSNRSTSAAIKELPRVAILQRSPRAIFQQRGSNRTFFVRGFNYVRLRGDHATFDAATKKTQAHYDPDHAEQMFETLARHGYNTVRVFISGRSPQAPGIAGNYDSTPGIYAPYMDNVIDFLQRARRHGIYVLPTFGDGELPRNAFFRKRLNDLPKTKNAIYLTREGIDAKKLYVTSFLRAIQQRDAALMSTILALQCQNELYMRGDQWPFDKTSGSFTGVDGTTYDLASAEDRRALMDDGLQIYHSELVGAIKGIDGQLLVTEGLFALRAVGKALATHQGIWPGSSGDDRFPPTLLALGQGPLDFLDIHFYRTRSQETIEVAFTKDMESSQLDADGMRQIRQQKPIIVGEFGSFRGVDPTFQQAAKNLLAARDLFVEREFNGMLYWTFDTFEQKRLYPAIVGGEDFLHELNSFQPPSDAQRESD